MKHLHILNLGAGVQSTTLALLFHDGAIRDDAGDPVRLTAAIFADTQEEPTDPGENVYDHLAWLEANVGFPIVRETVGKLGDDLMQGRNSTGHRFVSIPAFTLRPDGTEGKTRRQCTREYKIEAIERSIRRRILGLQPRKHIPRDVMVHQYIGISLDEIGRMLSAKARAEKDGLPRWSRFHYPLCESIRWTRAECRAFLKPRVPHRVPRSACVFCPFHDNEEWQRIKTRNGADWKRVVEIDHALRIPGNIVNRNVDQQLFLHRDCRPIDQIDFTAPESQGDLPFASECTGFCGH